MAHPEYQLQCAVVQFLNHALADDVLWTHFPMGQNRSKAQRGMLMAMGTKPGWPDLQFILPPNGRYAGIELKVGSRKLSSEQEAFSDTARMKAGALYAVCRSIPDVEGTLKGWGVSLKATT